MNWIKIDFNKPYPKGVCLFKNKRARLEENRYGVGTCSNFGQVFLFMPHQNKLLCKFVNDFTHYAIIEPMAEPVDGQAIQDKTDIATAPKNN